MYDTMNACFYTKISKKNKHVDMLELFTYLDPQ